MPLNFPFQTSSTAPPDTLPHPADDPALIAFRKATNLRSVTRVDPSILEILDTSVYSVIYQYDEGAGSWEKQKQEGPMFVVRRDKSPEYVLFMLNRQTVRNVTIPLIPGEMKLTVVDTSTLQVARRAEKHKRGIWFTEGPAGVERFKQTILGICGEPTTKKDPEQDPSSSSSASPVSPVARPAPTTEDGFSRLFAGLLKPQPLNGSSSSVPAAKSSPLPTQSTEAPSRPPPASDHLSPPARPMSVTSDSTIREPIPVSFTTADRTIPDTHSTHSPHPPGQTVDDLLASILGMTIMPTPAVPRPLQPPISASPRPTSPRPVLPEEHVPSRSIQDTIPVLAKKSSRVGDATFAQATQNQSLPQQPENTLNASTNSHNSTSTRYPNSSSSDSSPYLTANPTPLHSRQVSRGNVPGRSMSPSMRGQMERMAMGEAIGRGYMAAGVRSGQNGHGGKQVGGGEVEKRQFVQRILELIHTDQAFVDQIWGDYLSKTGQDAPG